VLKWSLDASPPDELARHHVKEASFHGVDSWTLNLTMKLPPGVSAADSDFSVEPSKAPWALRIDHVGIREHAMWPAKAAQKELGGRAMELFESVDNWVVDKTKGAADAMLMGCVGGVTMV
jgi:hypothetical protein